MISTKNIKEILRSEMQIKRNALPESRRLAAEKQGLQRLLLESEKYAAVISYDSFGSEFDTQTFNGILAKNKKLCLPVIKGDELHIFYVEDFSKQLKKHRLSFREPVPELCKKWEGNSGQTLMIVPGIAFDSHHYRLGYGKGYYDRFIASHPLLISTCGVGFSEQLVESVPIDDHDKRLDDILLF